MTGKAYLIGAGPGSPDLITVKGLRLIRSADVVLYDRLIPQELLTEARTDAELIFVGKRSGHHPMPQPQITALLLDKVWAGKQVARLKGGDPFVFGRGGEEAIALAEAGLPFEVVPGISSAIAAPGYAGVPVTQKGVSAAFGIVAGHETPDKPTSTTDWAAMAKLPTLVVLMGMKRLPFVVQALLDEGKSAETPAAVISQATTDHQQSIVGTLAELPRLVRIHKMPTPAVTVIGEVARFHDPFAWFHGNSDSSGFVDLSAQRTVRKVRIYITNNSRLLVLDQPNSPDAGVQVPGGTVEPDESILDAALRETREETGLTNLRVIDSVGQRYWHFPNVLVDSHYVHIVAEGDLPETWQHVERHANDDSGQHLFAFRWIAFDDVAVYAAQYPYFFCSAEAIINDETRRQVDANIEPFR